MVWFRRRDLKISCQAFAWLKRNTQKDDLQVCPWGHSWRKLLCVCSAYVFDDCSLLLQLGISWSPGLSCLFFPHICSVGFQPRMSKRQGQLVLHWPPDCILLLRLFCFSSHHLGALGQTECSKLCQTWTHSLHSPCVCTCATWESALS